MKRFRLVAILGALGAAVWLFVGTDAVSSIPKPAGGKTTREWVMGEYIPYLANEVQHYKWGKDLVFRSGWAFTVAGAVRSAGLGGTMADCPTSLDELKTSRFLPFAPIDRYAQTPLSGDFLRESFYSPTKGRPNLEGDLNSIQGQSPEGSVVFHRGTRSVEAVIVYVNQSSDGTRPSALNEYCATTKTTPAPQSPLLWKSLTDQINGMVRAYVAYTGKAPISMKDLDGTVGKMNPKAWNDPEIGPILKQISEKFLPLVQKSVKPEPAMGEFEPISVS